jgi:hypothetical protein
MAKKTKPLSQQQTEQFLMRTSKEFLQKLDDWRSQQRPILSRSEAMRRIVDQSLSPKGGAKK